jgi:hypothetical protein
LQVHPQGSQAMLAAREMRSNMKDSVGLDEAISPVTSVNCAFTVRAHHHCLGSAGPDDGQQ